jgi:hypothetical protein
MDTADAEKLRDNKTASVRFINSYSAVLNMSVSAIGSDENGQTVVLFSSKSHLYDLTAPRELSALIVFDRETGLSIPKEAVHTDADKPYIYLLTGLQAEKVPVDIIGERDGKMVVRDGAESKTVLRAGAQVIVKGKDLYDGKVIDR